MATRRKKMENPETIPKSDFVELLKCFVRLEEKYKNLDIRLRILESSIKDIDDTDLLEPEDMEWISDNEVFSQIPN